MEISKDISLITNAEVLHCLQESGEEKHKSRCDEYNWVRRTVTRYLEMTPAGHLTQEKMETFLGRLQEFEQRNNIKFTPNEKMQMMNIVPVQPVDVHIIVEECPERMTDDQVDELISIVTSTL
ncbi:hypothetical protein WA556_006821, partial [Blastocystis sp. ATCC 50177/Nand II]